MSRRADKPKENRLHYVFNWLLEFDQRHRFYLKRLKAPAKTKEAEAERIGARELLELSLEILRACESVSGNPLFTWWAVKVCIEAELPFPAWVQGYLAKSAQALLFETISTGRRSQKTAIEAGLGFTPGGSGRARGSKNRFVGFLKTIEEARDLARLYHARLYSDATFEEIETRLAAERYPKNERLREAYHRSLTSWRKALSKLPADIEI